MPALEEATEPQSAPIGAQNDAGDASLSSDPDPTNILRVDKLKLNTWCEGIVVRPSGDVLATRIGEAPELCNIQVSSQWNDIDQTNGDQNNGDQNNGDQNNGDHTVAHKPVVIHTFADATGAFNICRLPGAGTEKEEYAVMTGYNDPTSQTYHNVTIWRFSFETATSAPVVSKMAVLSDASFCLGLEAVSSDVLAVADLLKQRIWRVHLPTSTTSVLLDDPTTMTPLHPDEPFSINSVRIAAGYVWYTNYSSGILYRAPVEHTDTSGGADIRVSGPGVAVAGGLANPDGLVVKRDGSVAYVVSYTQGILWRIDIDDSTGNGTVAEVLNNLLTPTGMDLVYGDDDEDEDPTLYIICCGVLNHKLVAGSHGSWIKFVNVDSSPVKLMVTVTTTIEVTYSSAEDDHGEEGRRFWVNIS